MTMVILVKGNVGVIFPLCRKYCERKYCWIDGVNWACNVTTITSYLPRYCKDFNQTVTSFQDDYLICKLCGRMLVLRVFHFLRFCCEPIVFRVTVSVVQ